MKSLFYTLAGAAVVLALAAGPADAQGRERPGGGGGGGGATGGGGGGGVRTGGGGGGGMGGSSGGGGGAVAVPRGPSGGSSGSTYTPPSSGGSSSGSSGSGGATWRNNPANGHSTYVRDLYGSPSDRAVPRGARPNPGGRVVGQAMLRPELPGQRFGNDNINWYWNPWLFTGYGAYSLFYYDPFWWNGWWGPAYGSPYGPYGYGSYGYGPYGYGGYGYGGYGYGGYGYGGYGYGGYAGDEQTGRGALKIKVEPNDAEVYVDGYYMGVVDDFDGAFQKMELEAGAHHVEIKAAGYQTLAFDVRIESNQTVTYRGTMQAISKK